MISKMLRKFNPCNYERFEWLNKVNSLLSLVWNLFTMRTGCACCLGMRVILLAIVTFITGFLCHARW